MKIIYWLTQFSICSYDTPRRRMIYSVSIFLFFFSSLGFYHFNNKVNTLWHTVWPRRRLYNKTVFTTRIWRREQHNILWIFIRYVFPSTAPLPTADGLPVHSLIYYYISTPSLYDVLVPRQSPRTRFSSDRASSQQSTRMSERGRERGIFTYLYWTLQYIYYICIYTRYSITSVRLKTFTYTYYMTGMF